MTIAPEVLLNEAIKRIGAAELGSIIHAAAAGCGSRRDVKSIVRIAKANGADPTVTCAAFGFLPRWVPARAEHAGFVDMFRPNKKHGYGDLPDSPAVIAAFGISRAVYGGTNNVNTFRYSPVPDRRVPSLEEKAERATKISNIVRRLKATRISNSIRRRRAARI